jgi:glycosyltransferase involved in cell wall biosynthesis
MILSVIVPAHNEGRTLRAAVERLRAAELPVTLEVIGVDDGSTDDTAGIFEALLREGACQQVLRHGARQGKGAAVRLAIPATSGDVVVVQDADLEYDPADLAPMLALLQQQSADAVCGTRFGSGARTVLFFWRSIANRALTLWCNAFCNLNLSDVNCGYKLVRGELLRSLPLRSRGFTIEVELVARLAVRGARIWEVPVTYAGRRNGDGRKTRWWHALEQAWAIPQFHFRTKRS